VLWLIPPDHPQQVDTMLDAGADDCMVAGDSPRLFVQRVRHALRNPEAKYHNLFDAASDLIFITDRHSGQVLDANAHTAQWLGFTRADLAGFQCSDLVQPVRSREEITAELTAQGRVIYEAHLVTSAGERLPVEISARPVDYDGQPAVLNVARDVRHRKIAEDHEHEQRLLAEALSASAAVLNSSLDLNSVLDNILRVAMGLIPADSVNVMMIYDNGLAEVIGRRGRDDQFVKPRTRAFQYETVPTLKWIYDHQEVRYIPDVYQYSGWFKTEEEHWQRSYIGAPVIIDGRVSGLINVDGSRPHQFSEQHIEYLKAFADQASIAIRNARLYAQVQSHAEELEQRVQERTEELERINRSLQDEVQQRREVERVLEAERNLLRTLLDALPDQIAIKDSEGRYALVNAAMLRHMRQYRPEGELLGLTDFDFLLRPLAEQAQAEERRLLEGGPSLLNKEIEVYAPVAGHKRYMLISKIPLMDHTGRPSAVLSISRDITELRRVESEMAHVIASANCLLWYADVVYEQDALNWEIHITNDDVAQQFLPLALGEGETYADAWDRFVISGDLARLRSRTLNALLEQLPAYSEEVRLWRADGDVRWINFDVRVTVLHDSRWSLVGVCTDVTERKAAEDLLRRANEDLERRVQGRTAELLETANRLRDSEAKYATLTNNLPIGVYRISPDMRMLYCNHAMAVMLGFERAEDLLGADIQPFYASDRRPDRENQLRVERNAVYKDEVRLQARSGEFLWVMNSWHAIYDDQGQIVSFDGTVENITERKKVEAAEVEQRVLAEALSDTAAQLNSTLELQEVLARMIVQIERVMPPVDSVGIMLIEDSDYVRQIRYQRGDHVIEFNPLRYRLDLVRNLVDMRRTGQPILIADTREDERWARIAETDWIRSYLGAPILSDGEVIGFLNLAGSVPHVFRPEHGARLLAFANQLGIAVKNARLYAQVQQAATTLRQQVEERTVELRQQTRLLNAVLNAMIEGVVYYDATQKPVFSNRAMQSLTGFTFKDYAAAAHELVSLLTAPNGKNTAEMLADISAGISTGGLWRSEVGMRTRDNRVFDADLTITRVDDDDGKPMGAVAVLRDISQEKALTEQRRKFVAYASHELRTPLTNLSTRLYLMRKQPERMPEHLQIMEEVVGRMRQLAEDLLDISRLESGAITLDPTITELQALLHDVIVVNLPEAEKKGIRVVEQMPSKPVLAWVDVPRMWRVLVNLFTNAVNYTPEGGVITITVTGDEQRAAIAVSDTGAGIPEEMREDIFRLFVRGHTDKTGSGLGLTIVREIVELHGGTIGLQSELGKGATFTIWLDKVVSDGAP
jgi:PAS domain S-box-containing protein